VPWLLEGAWSPTKLVALQASVALAKEALVPAPGGNVAPLRSNESPLHNLLTSGILISRYITTEEDP
jgi:hypothetical protein